MPNGKVVDHPITDLLIHYKHPFPPDMEEMIRRLHAINPALLDNLELEPFDRERGKNLRQGRKRLRELLAEFGGDSLR